MSAFSPLQDDLITTNLLSDWGAGGFWRLSGLAVVVVLLFAMARPVIAQSYQELSQPRKHLQQRRAEPQPSPSSSSPSNLPDWAEPSQSREGSFSGESVESKAMGPPGSPSDPPQVPVDGGLALLAAAGAGYAVRKLNEDDEDDDLP